MNILDEIAAFKKEEVKERKSLFPEKLLEQSIYFQTKPVSLKKYLGREDKSGIIAEIKKRSPSAGDINPYASLERISIGYMQAGASGLSVLTDKKYFNGKNEDLTTARNFNFCPIIRKDFIIDDYQIVEAKSIGADVILLIASMLSKHECEHLAKKAKSLGLEVLLEIHTKNEIDYLNDWIDIVGVNNRDLKTFKTDVETSKKLADLVPANVTKISESGISNPQIIIELKKFGYSGFLIGEYFMKHGRPEKICKNLIDNINHLESIQQDT